MGLGINPILKIDFLEIIKITQKGYVQNHWILAQGGNAKTMLAYFYDLSPPLLRKNLFRHWWTCFFDLPIEDDPPYWIGYSSRYQNFVKFMDSVFWKMRINIPWAQRRNSFNWILFQPPFITGNVFYFKMLTKNYKKRYFITFFALFIMIFLKSQ